MDKRAYFKFTYGLFVVGVEYLGKLNGCIINTAAQATSEPGRLVATMMKSNFTTENIIQKGSMTVSILAANCPLGIISLFGMHSSREKEKFAGLAYETDQWGNPYLLDNIIARFSCRVEQKLDLDSHYLFILGVDDSQVTGDQEPLTYGEYRRLKGAGDRVAENPNPLRAIAPSEAETGKRWICSICHYVYDGEIPFEELPADWRCPVCGRGKEVFVSE